MKQLIIIGAGGMGKDLYRIATECDGYKRDYLVKGYLDYPKDDWDSVNYPPILGVEDDYIISDNDIFICSLGDVQLKRKVCNKILKRGGKFISLIHPRAEIGKNVSVGCGNIIDREVIIGPGVTIGNFNMIQTRTIIGHDSIIGDWNRFDCNVLCVGGVTVDNAATIHTSSVISHNVTIGDDAVVGAMSFVIRKVHAGTTVYGNPAKKLDY